MPRKKQTIKKTEIETESIEPLESEKLIELEIIESKKLKESKQSKEPNWNDNIKQESLNNALKVGIIYPKFKPYKNTVYVIILISKPKYVDNEKGKFHTINIERDNMKYSLNMNESFKFQLALFLKRNECTLDDLINRGVPLHVSKDDSGFFTIQKL